MARSITASLLTQSQNQCRTQMRWYIEIDSFVHGMLKLCNQGVTMAGVFPWLIGDVSGYRDGGTVSELSFLLSSDAADRIATEPLENHPCRVYRYRDTFADRQLIHDGIVWGDTGGSASNQYAFRAIGSAATGIQGSVPRRVFNGGGWYDYYQVPEINLKRAIPLVIGEVDESVPALAKAGGWGTLANAMPAYNSDWTGVISLNTGSGHRFNPAGGSTVLTGALTKSTELIHVASLSNFTTDYSWLWIVLYKSATEFELCRCRVSDADLRAYRGCLGIPARDDFILSTPIFEIGFAKIDNEIIAYRQASGDSLTMLKRGIASTPEAHVAGASVREYLPTFLWVANDRNVIAGGIKREKLYWFNSSQGGLVGNPFRDVEVRRNDSDPEQVQTVATVRVKSIYGSTQIGLTGHYTQSGISRENVDMDSISADGDSSGNWNDTANAIDDEGADPHAQPPVDPTTFAYNLAVLATEDIYCSGVERHSSYPSEPEAFFEVDLAAMADANPDTCGSVMQHIGSDVWAEYYLWTSDRPANYDEIVKIEVSAKMIFEGTTYFRIDAMIPSIPGGYDMFYDSSNEWQSKVIFNLSYQNQVNTDLETYFQDSETWDTGLVFRMEFDHNDSAWMSVQLYEIVLTISTTSHGWLKTRNTGDPSHIVDTIGTAIQVYVDGGTYQVSYAGQWDGVADTYHEFTAAGWHEITIPNSDLWDDVTDWQEYIRIRPKERDRACKIYQIRLVNYYTVYGEWVNLPAAIDADLDTYAQYNAATSGGHYAEFYRAAEVSSNLAVQRVRIKLRYTHNLQDICAVGIGTVSGGGAPPAGINWHTIPTGNTAEIFIDVTEDHPSGGTNWSWQDFNTSGTGQDFSIYLHVQGNDGQSMRVYDVQWDVITAVTHIDPANTPLVCWLQGCEDVLGGLYTESGGLITNPADVERYLLQTVCNPPLASSELDLTAYIALRDHFDALGVKCRMQLFDAVPSQQFFDRYREAFGYRVLDVNGVLTPKTWPASTTASSATLNHTNIIADSFSTALTGMEEIVNCPVIYYKPRYYASDYEQIMLSRLEKADTDMIMKKWKNPLKIDSFDNKLKYKYGNQCSIENLINTTYYDTAQQSYRDYNNTWFRKPMYLDYVRDSASAIALASEILRRFAYRRRTFEFLVDASIGDTLRQYDVVTLQHYLVPRIPGKTTPVVDGQWGHINSVKIVILTVEPSGTARRISCEVL